MDGINNIPIKLNNARAWRAYLGGSLLNQFHGLKDNEDGHFPEEWIMSNVSARNLGRESILEEGLSKLSANEAISLKSLIDAEPSAFLGVEHVKKFGDQTGVLIKIIDSAERLPVQVHPDRRKAKELFQSDYGKTECWHILGGRNQNGNTSCVYFGFKEGITREHWRKLFEKQDTAGILDCMHRFEVKKGDTILIDGGIPHAIGAGCFLVEIQEPTDYTFRVEKKTPSGFQLSDDMCHQGIGYDKMFDCFQYGGMSKEETYHRWFIKPQLQEQQEGGSITALLGYENTEYFKMNLLVVEDELTIKTNSTFSGLYILQGDGRIITDTSCEELCKGNQFFIPASTEKFTLKRIGYEPLKIIQCFGPK
jgi:mannose-6-phosphate isomerase